MDKVPVSQCQDYEDEWFKVTHALADSEDDLAQAMLDYRAHGADHGSIRVSQALLKREHAKEVVESLMHIIWQRLF